MSFEQPQRPESEIIKEEAMNAYKPIIDRGFKNPGNLGTGDVSPISPADPEIKAANKLFYEWMAQLDAEAAGNQELQIRANLAKTMFYVDAGFTDPDFLDETLKEFLFQDAADVKKESDNPDRIETRRQYAEAIKKVRGLLKQE